jgi:Tol biopolymer transport system component
VWIGSPLGTGRREVLQRPRHVTIEPSFSPDGQRIVFESRRGEPDGSPGTRLWRIPAPA